MPTKMNAIVQNEYGTSDVLHLDKIERPEFGADEALVRVHAAGLDRDFNASVNILLAAGQVDRRWESTRFLRSKKKGDAVELMSDFGWPKQPMQKR